MPETRDYIIVLILVEGPGRITYSLRQIAPIAIGDSRSFGLSDVDC